VYKKQDVDRPDLSVGNHPEWANVAEVRVHVAEHLDAPFDNIIEMIGQRKSHDLVIKTSAYAVFRVGAVARVYINSDPVMSQDVSSKTPSGIPADSYLENLEIFLSNLGQLESHDFAYKAINIPLFSSSVQDSVQYSESNPFPSELVQRLADVLHKTIWRSDNSPHLEHIYVRWEGTLPPDQLAQVLNFFEIEASDKDSAPPSEMPDQFHSDRPIEKIEDDDLGRNAIAKNIATNVGRVWKDQMDHSRPFAVHLSGRWGSGKSTILNFLRKHLSDDTKHSPRSSGTIYPVEPEGWVVVDYNAWKMQDAGPPWWSLLTTVTDQGYSALGGQGAYLKLKDRIWRFGKINRFWLILFTILALLFATFMIIGPSDNSTQTITTEITETVGSTKTTDKTVDPVRAPNTFLSPGTPWGFAAAIITALGSLGALGKILQGFTKTSQETAEAVRTLQTDPTAHIKARYSQVIKDINRPVAVFIDDLDRCDAKFVVDLLQALQTAYAAVPVLYVVASDRDWIVSAYNQVYKDFQAEVAKPGLPLGFLFVKKIFQLSVSVPDLAENDTEKLTKALLEIKPIATSVVDIANIESTFDDRIKDAVEDGDMATLTEIGVEAAKSPAANQLAAKLMEAVGSDEIQKKVRHALITHVPLMDGNPRALKRLINAVTFRQGYILMAGAKIDFEIIARWSILSLRFPYTAELIAQTPSLRDPANRNEAMNAKFFHDPTIDKILERMTQSDIAKIREFG
jgi:hypothetical protein